MYAKYDLTELGEWVRDVMRKKRVDANAAATIVTKSITKAGLAEWWAGTGWHLVRLAERTLLGDGPGPRPFATTVKHNPSYRARFASDPEAWLDMELPIGCSGVRMRIGDMTHDDIRVVVDWYVAFGETIQQRARGFLALSKHVTGDQTLEQAYRAGDLTDDDVDFLRGRCRLPSEVEEPAAGTPRS